MFVDHIRIFAQAGNGGRGCVSFRREKFVPKGGPDGGDGGRGGDVILRADQHTDQLSNLFYEPIIKAKSGEHGQGKKMHGRNAPAKVVKVPVGTIVYRAAACKSDGVNADLEVHADDAPAPARFEPGEQIADLTQDGQEFLLCEGGSGGKGNVHFKSSRNRAPREFTEGGEGESGYFFLELRTIADAALVGYPNAGKSTLLRALSAAQPKVAPYPFTTLHPVIGVVELGEYRRATVADIPGLIEGAHRNLGLGHEFLRHITRCAVFLLVVDMAGSEGRSPVSDVASLRRELDLYDARLAERPWFVVANKMDLPDANENLVLFRARFPQLTILPVSGKEGAGIGELKHLIEQWVFKKPELHEATI
ncbi:MAG: GTPase ObgE [Verrucomicrobia bacterium]|nr:GTPase ObgE [Verrucomicrobiota bacterium]